MMDRRRFDRVAGLFKRGQQRLDLPPPPWIAGTSFLRNGACLWAHAEEQRETALLFFAQPSGVIRLLISR
jgi:hypothetical protein